MTAHARISASSLQAKLGARVKAPETCSPSVIQLCSLLMELYSNIVLGFNFNGKRKPPFFISFNKNPRP
jgi:hypothetical protein